jgi:hypothetical protein
MSEAKFRRASARGRPVELSEPLPLTVVELVPAQAKRHRAVVENERKLRAQVVELHREVEAAERADQERVTEATIAGEPRPRARRGAGARKRLETVEAEATAFANSVGRSADLLLQRALPHFEAAAEKAEEAEAEALARVVDLLAAADRALADANRLRSEFLFLTEGIDRRGQIDPFRPLEDGDIRRLRVALSGALHEFETKRAERQAERERLEAWERENRPGWEAAEAQARAQADRERVVVSEGRVVEKGGKAVRRGAFGFEPVEGEEES